MNEPALARILVVDDELHIADSVRRALERLGYAVDVASDPETAWSILGRTHIAYLLEPFARNTGPAVALGALIG